MLNLEDKEVFKMESTSNDSNSLSPPKKNSKVFESLWIKKDTNIRLECCLLGDLPKHNGRRNFNMAIESNERCRVAGVFDVSKRNFRIESSFVNHRPFRSFIKNEDCCLVPGSALSHEAFHGSLGMYRNRSTLTQEHQIESSKQGGTLEKQRENCFVPNFIQSRQPESSLQDRTPGQNGSGSSQTRTNSTSNIDPLVKESPEERSSRNSISARSNSDELDQNRTGTKRSKQFEKRLLKKESQSSEEDQCDFCPEIFVQRSAFVSHRRSHTGKTPSQCLTCGQILHSRWSLKQHLLQHQTVLLKTCETCGKRFRSDSSLKDHTNVHKKLLGPYSCGVCGRQFARKIFLDRHLPNCPDQQNALS